MAGSALAQPSGRQGGGTGGKELAVDLGGGVKLEMVLIPAGSFMMGSGENIKEKPVHKVSITKPFYLGKYAVTQEQWEAVMGSNPSHLKGAKNPVERVSRDDCQAFLIKLNAKTGGKGGKFVLPTEAQWEYACRAGSTTKYCFGDDETRLGEYAWYGVKSKSETHPVGEKKPNAWGLYDMHGNVWEWCQDLYGAYRAEAVNDPSGPKEPAPDPRGPRSLTGVFRGGFGDYPAEDCRSASRNYGGTGSRDRHLGMRVARVPADK